MGPVVVLIRDGWGFRDSAYKNAIMEANTPETDALMQKYPNILLRASGTAVGLPSGYQGNSEVGHMTIGSGRIIKQSMVRIDDAIHDGSFMSNNEFNTAITNCLEKGTTLHLIGLLQSEGVHSHYLHLYSLMDLAKQRGLKKICVHVITDGRDAPVHAAEEKVDKLNQKIRSLGVGAIATISGRYYAMDRNKRWERTEKAYRAIADGKAPVLWSLHDCYSHGETDEFLTPRKAPWYRGIVDGDSVIFFNFRTDRTRQLTQALIEKGFSGFERKKKDICFVAMTQYYKPMDGLVAFKEENIHNHLGEVLSDAGKRQLRISETEKYAHVTFFFNCQKENPYPGEDRVLIRSPDVATYDMKPEMSAYEITERAISGIGSGKYDVIIMNIVNGDMVGHTGVHDAIIKAVETVDTCVGMVVKKTVDMDGAVLILGDHGNAEDQREEWRTSHTTNPVPFILVSGKKTRLKEKGNLSDIAPTVLDILHIKKPDEMAGSSLIIPE